MIKTTLKNIIESQDSRAGYIFDLFIQILIVLSLVAFTFDTIPDEYQTSYCISHVTAFNGATKSNKRKRSRHERVGKIFRVPKSVRMHCEMQYDVV